MPTKTKAAPSAYATPERASANFVLKFGLVSIPVAMKPLLENLRSQVSGTTLCPEHMEKLSQRYICGEGQDHEHLLTKGDTIIGYETSKKSGQFVVLDDSIVDEIVLERTGDLAIERIAPMNTIDPSFFEKPYLCWPQNSGAGEAFDLLTAILRETNKVAICRGVLSKRTKTIVFAWSEYHNVLLGYVCAYSSQIRERDLELARQGSAARKQITATHIKAAMPLLAQLDGDFDPSENADEYTPVLLEAIATAAGGDAPKRPTARKAIEKVETDDLLAALQASVADAPAASKTKPKGSRKTATKA